MRAINSRKSQGRNLQRQSFVTYQPKSVNDVVAVMRDAEKFPTPVRPVGSGSSATRCNQSQRGTILDMTLMKAFIKMTDKTVTVGAGMSLRSLADRLANEGMELVGGYEYPERTVGGLISSGSLAAGVPGDTGHLAGSVLGVTMVTPQGRQVSIGNDQPELLGMVRQGFGLLGVICAVTLMIRPIRTYTIRNHELDFAELGRFIPDIADAKAGVKLFLLPFRDRAFAELRFAKTSQQQSGKLPWKIRDWACNRAIPDFIHSVGRMVPISKIRDPLIDSVSETTQRFVNKRLSVVGSNAMEQTGQFRKVRQSTSIAYTTWLFTAESFPDVVNAYRDFCQSYYQNSGFRCDLPSIAYRIDQDATAFLSPSFDGPLFALKLRSTNLDGWDDFLFEFADFAASHSGIPLFNQTRGMASGQAVEAYGERLQRFAKVRRQLDPENRCLNQFFAEYIG